jgi:hypothetical protein
LQDRQF